VSPYENERAKATALGLEILTQAEAQAENQDARFGSQSLTSSWRAINDTMVPIERVHDIDQKVQSAVKAFGGPKAFDQSSFVSFPSRIRRIRSGMKMLWVEFGKQVADIDAMRRNLRSFPQAYTEFIRRSDLSQVIPTPLVPSYTISTGTMGGAAGLAEFPGNVLPLPTSGSQVPDRTESVSAVS
jgi:hypothetical protein